MMVFVVLCQSGVASDTEKLGHATSYYAAVQVWTLAGPAVLLHLRPRFLLRGAMRAAGSAAGQAPVRLARAGCPGAGGGRELGGGFPPAHRRPAPRPGRFHLAP